MNLAPVRAAARIARRQARRSPGRSALVVALVALPVTALSGAAVVIQTAEATPDERATEYMGTADVTVDGWTKGSRPVALLEDLPAGTVLARHRALDVPVPLGGASTLQFLQVEEFSAPVDRRPVRGIFRMLEGRVPTAPGEVALDPQTLRSLAAEIGERVEFEAVHLSVRVTGTIVRRGGIGQWVVVAGPGTLAGRRSDWPTQLLVDLPAGADVASFLRTLRRARATEGFTSRADYEQGGSDETAAATGVSFALTAAGLFATGLIAAAAFVVGARRQLRTLGLVGAAGGESRHVRAIVLLGGAALGVAGSVLGAALGVAGALLAHPHLGRFIGRDPGPVEIPVPALAGAVGLGTLAAVLAAWGPARSAARLSTVQALAGRAPPPRAPGRLAGLGLAGVGVGAALAAWGAVGESEPELTAGVLLMLAGFLVAIPLLVSWVGRVARYLPAAARLSAREIARHGRRTGAALAAATMALALPVAVGALTLSEEAQERRIPFMARDHLMVSLYVPGDDRPEQLPALLEDLRAAFPGSVLAPLRAAVYFEPGDGGRRVESQAWVEGPAIESDAPVPEGVALRESGGLLVGGADLLRALHAEDGIPALAAGKAVGIGPGTTDGGRIHVFSAPDDAGNETVVEVPAVEAGSTRYQSIGPGGEFLYVISPQRTRGLGLRASRWSDGFPRFLLRGPTAWDEAAVERARELASERPGGYVTSLEDLGSDAGPVLMALNVVGGAVALAVVAVIVALVAAEARRDQAILVAVGAGPGRRRRVAGARAFLLAALAGLLSVPAGFVPMTVVREAQQGDRPVLVPWVAIAVVMLAVPLVAGTVGAAFSRQPKAGQLLRPLA